MRGAGNEPLGYGRDRPTRSLAAPRPGLTRWVRAVASITVTKSLAARAYPDNAARRPRCYCRLTG